MFTDPDEECVYHPGPPEFHEGQKGENDPIGFILSHETYARSGINSE